MRISSRIKKLERHFSDKQELWAVFTIDYCDDPIQKAISMQRLKDECIARENLHPTHCLFINEIPALYPNQKNKFLHSFRY